MKNKLLLNLAVFIGVLVCLFYFWSNPNRLLLLLLSVLLAGMMLALHPESWHRPIVRSLVVGILLTTLSIGLHMLFWIKMLHFTLLVVLLYFTESRELRFLGFAVWLLVRLPFILLKNRLRSSRTSKHFYI
jgi:hypothetical protein